jgi:predicted GIY-YIG superfamily endonuclease
MCSLHVRNQLGIFALLTPETFGDSGCNLASEDQLPKKLRTESKPDGAWFVYLLRCADGSLYTGITNDLPRRLEKHNAGIASRYTRSRLPVVLVYQEAQASRSLALKRELAIKALSRQAKELLIRPTRMTTRQAKTK